MQKNLVIVLFISVLAGYGAASAQTNGPGDAIETTSSGKINWTAGEVYAAGIGAPPASAVNAGQARAMTERAAVVVAYRNLLEVVKGVRVDSETVVENFITKSDIVRTRVEGIVKGARIVKKQYLSDGSVEVLIAMPLKGALMDAIVPEIFGRPSSQQPLKTSPQPQRPTDIKQPSKPTEPSLPPVTPPSVPEKKPEPVKPTIPPAAITPEKKPEPMLPTAQSAGVFKGGVATGLVIDGRGLALRPALLPRIIDSQGQEIYVGQVVTRTNAVEQGVAGYAKDVTAAANNFRVTDNPAVIKGLRASGSSRTDIIVAQADAQMLRELGNKGDFLQNCRVIIVY
jgi:hypothetical protein